jgi:hypothetical protein
MTHDQSMHCTYSIADKNMEISMTLRHFLSKSVNQPSYFHMNKCIYGHSTTTMNSFPSNIRMNIIPCFNSSGTNITLLKPARHLINNPTLPSQFSLNLCTEWPLTEVRQCLQLMLRYTYSVSNR